MNNEEIKGEIMALADKRKQLILKVIGQLYKGSVGTLHFKNGGIYKVDYVKRYNLEEKEKRQLNPFGNFEELKEELMKNIHDISKDFEGENLSILEFLMDKMDMEWEYDVTARADSKYLKELKDKIQTDFQAIKNRCANYLLIMAIEESEK